MLRRLLLLTLTLGILCVSFPSFAQTCTGLCLQQTSCPGSGTTSLSGTVYAPNGTDPLPNVLVYVPNGTVEAFSTGASCVASVQPVTGSPLVSAVTATDGTFTLTNMPVGTNIPLVIQIGKWRRQVVIPTVTACTNTAVPAALSHLPTSHAQGDIPKIAIVTGASDAIECVLQKVGIAQSEFTDPSGSGRVNFYQGDGSSSSTGAEIDSSTPTEATLEASQSAMNAYDAVMFGCQGGAYTESNTALGYLANFANAGGRVFATHYEYVWLNTNAGFQSTVDWAVGGPDPTPDPGTGVINQNQSFPKGIQLASWLTDVGASSTPGEITISTLRNDQTGAISPTASWMTDGSDIMQFTFNTPVGVASDQQCGRVLFNEYHVEDTSGTTTKGMKFPAECSTGAMTAQEKLLEYSLFDLMNALTSDVPPTATISVSNSPSAFVQGDSADNVTINVTDTTSTIATNPSLSVTAVLPTGLAPYSMEGTNANTGWLCTAATLTCTRTTGLNGGASDPITLMVTVASNAPITSGATISAMVSGGGLAASVSGQDSVPIKGLPLITWNTPAAITYGTALGAAQLNATSGGVAGTFVYTPAAGTVPGAAANSLGHVHSDRQHRLCACDNHGDAAGEQGDADDHVGEPGGDQLRHDVEWDAAKRDRIRSWHLRLYAGRGEHSSDWQRHLVGDLYSDGHDGLQQSKRDGDAAGEQGDTDDHVGEPGGDQLRHDVEWDAAKRDGIRPWHLRLYAGRGEHSSDRQRHFVGDLYSDGHDGLQQSRRDGDAAGEQGDTDDHVGEPGGDQLRHDVEWDAAKRDGIRPWHLRLYAGRGEHPSDRQRHLVGDLYSDGHDGLQQSKRDGDAAGEQGDTDDHVGESGGDQLRHDVEWDAAKRDGIRSWHLRLYAGRGEHPSDWQRHLVGDLYSDGHDGLQQSKRDGDAAGEQGDTDDHVGEPGGDQLRHDVSGTQLNATASVPGTFAYTPAAGALQRLAATLCR